MILENIFLKKERRMVGLLENIPQDRLNNDTAAHIPSVPLLY